MGGAAGLEELRSESGTILTSSTNGLASSSDQGSGRNLPPTR